MSSNNSAEQAYWEQFEKDSNTQHWFKRHERACEQANGETVPRLVVTPEEYAEMQDNARPWTEIAGEPAWGGVIVEVSP